MIKRAFLVLLATLLLTAGLSVWAEEPATLIGLVDAVLAHNAGMRAADARVAEAQSGRREAQMMRFPMLSARSQFTRSDQPVYVFGSLMEQGRFGPADFAIDQLNHPGDLTNIQSAIDLGLPLFSGFEVTSATRKGELATQQAKSGREGVAQELRYEAASIYLQLLLDRDLLKTLDDRLAASAQEVEDARKLKERGVVLGSDYYAAEAIVGGLQAWRLQVATDQSANSTRLAILSGKDAWELKETLSSETPPAPDSTEWIKVALLRRPDLAAAESNSAIAQENERQAGRSLLPKIQAFASLETNTNDFGYNPANHTFGVAAKLPFGDPGYLARRSRTAAEAQATQETKKNLEESIQIQVAEAYEAYQGAIAMIPVAKETLDRAAKSLDLFRPLYHSGRQSILEVLRAEEGLAKAQAAYSQALAQVQTSYLSLLRASGALDDRAIQNISRTLEAHP